MEASWTRIRPAALRLSRVSSLREAITSRAFLLLYLALVVIWIGASMPFVHLVPYAEDYGLTHSTAVVIFGLIGVGSLAGRFALGGLADRLGRASY